MDHKHLGEKINMRFSWTNTVRIYHECKTSGKSFNLQYQYNLEKDFGWTWPSSPDKNHFTSQVFNTLRENMELNTTVSTSIRSWTVQDMRINSRRQILVLLITARRIGQLCLSFKYGNTDIGHSRAVKKENDLMCRVSNNIVRMEGFVCGSNHMKPWVLLINRKIYPFVMGPKCKKFC